MGHLLGLRVFGRLSVTVDLLVSDEDLQDGTRLVHIVRSNLTERVLQALPQEWELRVEGFSPSEYGEAGHAPDARRVAHAASALKAAGYRLRSRIGTLKRYVCQLLAVDEAGLEKEFGVFEVFAPDRKTARRRCIEDHWDDRLERAGLIPKVNVLDDV